MGAAIRSDIGSPGLPEPRATSRPPASATACTTWFCAAPVTSTVTLATDLSMSGTVLTRRIEVVGTGSIQTVCQIPLTEVYQMPDGFCVCFPRACVQLSVGSVTATTTSCSLPGERWSVISKLNGV